MGKKNNLPITLLLRTDLHIGRSIATTKSQQTDKHSRERVTTILEM